MHEYMNREPSNTHLPEEVLGLLASIFFLPAVAAVALLTAMLLPDIASFRRVGSTSLFAVGLLAGICGIVLLFFARLPLYRQHRFFTFGPRCLDGCHRRLYWLAYLFVLASIALLGFVWLSVA